MLCYGGVGGVLAARDLAEECEDSFLEGGLVREGDFGDIGREVVGLGFGGDFGGGRFC